MRSCVCFFFLSVLAWKKNKRLLMVLSLAVLANTHLFGLFAAISVSLCYLFHHFESNGFQRKDSLFLLGSTVVLLAAYAFSFLQCKPPSEHVSIFSTVDKLGIKRIVSASGLVMKGFFPLPDFTNEQLWNSNIFTTRLRPVGLHLNSNCFNCSFCCALEKEVGSIILRIVFRRYFSLHFFEWTKFGALWRIAFYILYYRLCFGSLVWKSRRWQFFFRCSEEEICALFAALPFCDCLLFLDSGFSLTVFTVSERVSGY